MPHTPGPWSVEDPLGPEILSIVAGEGRTPYEWVHVAQVSVEKEDPFDPTPAQAKANAKLLAAAPDLLKALRRCVEDLKPYGDEEDDPFADIGSTLREARDAIAKAEGR